MQLKCYLMLGCSSRNVVSFPFADLNGCQIPPVPRLICSHHCSPWSHHQSASTLAAVSFEAMSVLGYLIAVTWCAPVSRTFALQSTRNSVFLWSITSIHTHISLFGKTGLFWISSTWFNPPSLTHHKHTKHQINVTDYLFLLVCDSLFDFRVNQASSGFTQFKNNFYSLVFNSNTLSHFYALLWVHKESEKLTLLLPLVVCKGLVSIT